jgi:hypothetical protein
VRVTKELAWRGLEIPLEEALRLYTALGALVRASEDAHEGPRAFAEKRQPRFKGGKTNWKNSFASLSPREVGVRDMRPSTMPDDIDPRPWTA